uniref:PH domain-containing protein n=1 Tax=Heterorhabditis bacteriophora TaxID=37862 RepID=A0A1I7XIS0_HETBA
MESRKLKEGEILKYKSGFLSNKWKKHHAVLFSDSRFCWFAEKNDRKPKGSVLLKDVVPYICVGLMTDRMPVKRPSVPEGSSVHHLVGIGMDPRADTVHWILFASDSDIELADVKLFLHCNSERTDKIHSPPTKYPDAPPSVQSNYPPQPGARPPPYYGNSGAYPRPTSEYQNGTTYGGHLPSQTTVIVDRGMPSGLPGNVGGGYGGGGFGSTGLGFGSGMLMGSLMGYGLGSMWGGTSLFPSYNSGMGHGMGGGYYSDNDTTNITNNYYNSSGPEDGGGTHQASSSTPGDANMEYGGGGGGGGDNTQYSNAGNEIGYEDYGYDGDCQISMKGMFIKDGREEFSLNGGTKYEYKNDPRMASSFQKNQFTILVLVSQIGFMILFGLFAKYDADVMPGGSEDPEYMSSKYPPVSINLLLACYTIEWGMIVRGILGHEFANEGKFTIGLEQLLTADFAAAVVLISMGAMLGKLSPVQYLIMAFIETPIAIFIEHHVVHTFHVNDVGGSIIVHAFGAYFGLACSKAFGNKEQRDHESEGSVYHSDIFAMIGAIFLWVFWPSFNAGVAEPADARQRAVCNTFLSLCACTVMTFLVSQAVDKHKKFDMVHIANSTLAGGVAIGSTANVVINPLHAMMVGVAAAVLSVLGYKYITPKLSSNFGVHDTCGVNNLHGMPGILAGLLSAVLVVYYDPAIYGKSLNIIYPAMKSDINMEGHSARTQAVNQLIGVGVVLVGSLISGFITDGDYFETPSDYDFTTRIVSRIDRVEINEQTQLTQKDV